MKLVGITGGIGAGKSIIGKMLMSLGYPVFYSDKEAKELMTTSVEIQRNLIDLFGQNAYQNGELNRPFLAQQIFADKSKIQQMNNIVHPAVREHFNNWAKNQNSELVFNEAAILFETGAYKNFDYTILVTADESLRISRVMARDNISEEEVRNRMSKQWSDDKKVELANFVISNNENDLLIPQLNSILEKLTI